MQGCVIFCREHPGSRKFMERNSNYNLQQLTIGRMMYNQNVVLNN
jgi:hypothetical protein